MVATVVGVSLAEGSVGLIESSPLPLGGFRVRGGAGGVRSLPVLKLCMRCDCYAAMHS
jgi:hypothetical protein